MNIDKVGPATFKLTLHSIELSALIAAARWAKEGGEGEIAEEARRNLSQILERYDAEIKKFASASNGE